MHTATLFLTIYVPECCLLRRGMIVDRLTVVHEGANKTYEELFTAVRECLPGPPRLVLLQHYVDGPVFELYCHEFVPTREPQVLALGKNHLV